MSDVSAILSHLLAVLIGIFVGHYLTKIRMKQERFVEASKEFRDAFIDEIRQLGSGSEDAFNILKPAFVKHETAMLRFKPFLKSEKLHDFEQAWHEYCCGEISNSTIPFFEQYFAAGNVTKRRELAQLALTRLKKLASFAENL